MADGKGKIDQAQEKNLRSGKTYRTTQPRRASVIGAAAASQTKPKAMSAEDALTKALGKINESLEFLTKQGTDTSKQVAEISKKLDLNTSSLKELGTQVTANAQNIGRLLEESATTRKIAEEAKEVATEIQGKIPPVVKKLADHDLSFAMIDLQRRDRNLRLRFVPESEQDNLVDFITKEFYDFWQEGLQGEEVKIVSAFRLGIRKKRTSQETA